MGECRQIIEVLPRVRWAEVVVLENNEPIEPLLQNERIMLLAPEVLLRKTVTEMIISAANYLPSEYSLGVIEGVRSMEKQILRWNEVCARLKTEFPEHPEHFIEKQAGLLVARPTVLANHNCGGAVDVCLLRASTGERLDMGTPPQSGCDYMRSRMFSDLITAEQKSNRTILREAMVVAGFVWYPGEWWHYCYGDRMWAVYSDKSDCFYGPIQDIV